jgi:hypothetical protein
VVRKITADRGYGEASVDAELEAVGEKTVVIPRKGKPSAARREMEHTRGFRNLVKWRTGSEGRISTLKHGYDWDRTLFDGIGGARTWCGLGILAHNAVRIAPLMEACHVARIENLVPGSCSNGHRPTTRPTRSSQRLLSPPSAVPTRLRPQIWGRRAKSGGGGAGLGSHVPTPELYPALPERVFQAEVSSHDGRQIGDAYWPPSSAGR